MVTTVVSGDREFVQDLDSYECQRGIMIHELGHYACAKVLGIEAKIVFDINSKTFLLRHDLIDDPEKNIVIGLGGNTAEEICDFFSGGYISDMEQVYENLRVLKSSRGKEFLYRSQWDIPKEELQPYYDKCLEILTKVGGKPALEEAAEMYLDRLGITKN